ncbi:PREDICTED: tumor necrosis factor receptor superfamily member 13B [Apaloderma vittatum]|uniref:tumor necrosis factor receptor superfamily member 13B n=1 Tax=Apaloderma vittatum TaxID=57397 RepID=UPI0005213091|nr:PREDICTED: tumor necrosis factor receptor superfamily member 13B [Apaloderma vittatum]
MATPYLPASHSTGVNGMHVRWDVMNNCTDQQYWDTLVGQCIPCSLVCGSSTVRRCAVLCESMDCNKRAGFYYDELVRNCVNCSRVCGQHPKQCAPTCENRLVEAGSVGDGSTGSRVPEPVETCGFCFPGHASAVPETKSCHSTSCHIWERAVPCHTGICSTRSAGAMPSPDDGHFKIICSPSQEKTPMV